MGVTFTYTRSRVCDLHLGADMFNDGATSVLAHTVSVISFTPHVFKHGAKGDM